MVAALVIGRRRRRPGSTKGKNSLQSRIVEAGDTSWSSRLRVKIQSTNQLFD
jgi:hypothetical protein